MKLKVIRLIAKPDTWFKEGTEVYDYDEYGVRFTLDEYEEWKKSGNILARGIRVCKNPLSEGTENNLKVSGEEYIDGELCDIDEFEVEIHEY